MKLIEAGTRVTRGYYFGAKGWQLLPVERDGELLPGGAGEKYLRVSLAGAIAIAPLMGAAFLVFLPFIGVYLFAVAVTRPIAMLFQRSTTELAATVAPVMVPGRTHLTGQPAEEAEQAKPGEAAAAEGAPAHDPALEALQQEIEAKRKG